MTPFSTRKKLLRIIVQSAVRQKDVEILEVAPVKQDDGRGISLFVAKVIVAKAGHAANRTM